MRNDRNVTGAIAAVILVICTFTAAAQEKVLYSFGAFDTDGKRPLGSLIADRQGDLYGTTSSGGAYGIQAGGYGTVFELTLAADGGWTEKVLHSFGASSVDGAAPKARLIMDAKGNLYGTTSSGGDHNRGTAFELSRGLAGNWTERVLYHFGASGVDAAIPESGLVFDDRDNLYGASLSGGHYGKGAVFELTPQTSGDWKEKVLYDFGDSATAPATPGADLVFDRQGSLFGVTQEGGAHGKGTIFELRHAEDDEWAAKVIYSFGAANSDGSAPVSRLAFDADGNLYGATRNGGAFDDQGTVFELTREGCGSWTAGALYNFGAGDLDGTHPSAGLIIDEAGRLYGTTLAGGVNGTSSRGGTVFRMIPEVGGAWTEEVLQSFPSFSDGVEGPSSALLLDPAGNLFGITSQGGAYGMGAVFEVAQTTAAATPKFSLKTGTYAVKQSVKVTDATAGATIYYTTNGKTPTTSSTKYTKPIEVSASETIKAIADAKGFLQSGIASATYLIGRPAATPVFSVKTGTFTAAESVKITDATANSTIYYTTDGTTPTTSSHKYTGPITVSATETIEAVAVAKGYLDSAVAKATYTYAPLKLLLATLPGGADGGLIVPVGGMGYITVIPENQTDHDLTSVTVSASTGTAKLPLKITICADDTIDTSGCKSAPAKTVTLPTIPPADNQTLLITFQVESSAVIASSAANQITISFKSASGVLLASAIVPVTSSVPQVGVSAATTSGNGIVTVPVGGNSAFVVGAELQTAKALTSVTVSTAASDKLPLTITLCQTNPGTGQCLAPPTQAVTVATFAPGSKGTLTFSVFVSASGTIANDPANRIVVLFKDKDGAPIGSTSVGVDTSN